MKAVHNGKWTHQALGESGSKFSANPEGAAAETFIFTRFLRDNPVLRLKLRFSRVRNHSGQKRKELQQGFLFLTALDAFAFSFLHVLGNGNPGSEGTTRSPPCFAGVNVSPAEMCVDQFVCTSDWKETILIYIGSTVTARQHMSGLQTRLILQAVPVMYRVSLFKWLSP